jgi:hypothetical protein
MPLLLQYTYQMNFFELKEGKIFFERDIVKKQFEYYKEKPINSVHQHCI